MDPLSIIASTIAIATTVAQSLRKLRDIYKAPEELQKLADTIERFTPVLRQISIAFGSSSVEHIDSPDDGLLSLVQSANTRLNRLNDIYQRHAVENTSPGDKQRFKRLHWQKFRSEVTQISEELEKDHSSIQTVLSSYVNSNSNCNSDDILLQAVLLLVSLASRTNQLELKNEFSEA